MTTGLVGMVDYDRQQYAQYARGRALPVETVALWLQVFARHVPAQRPLTVLDLGCGVGRFTPALAEEFGGPVYGVEPSERMREVAQERAGHPAVTYLLRRSGADPVVGGQLRAGPDVPGAAPRTRPGLRGARDSPDPAPPAGSC